MFSFLKGFTSARNMSQCPDCGCDLPGFQTLCSECYDARYAGVGRPKSLLESIRQFGSNPRRRQGNRKPNQSIALVAGVVLCCYRPWFGLALRIRVVRWKPLFLLRACSESNRADCAGVCRCCSPDTLRDPRTKMAVCLPTFLSGFWRGIRHLEHPPDCLPMIARPLSRDAG